MDIFLIICGDYNFMFSSGVYDFFVIGCFFYDYFEWFG